MSQQRHMSRSASPSASRDTWRNLELVEEQNVSTHVLEKGTQFAGSFEDISLSSPGLCSERTTTQGTPREQASGDSSPVECQVDDDHDQTNVEPTTEHVSTAYGREQHLEAQAPAPRGATSELQFTKQDTSRRLPLPSLADTCSRFLLSINPFVNPYQHNAIKKDLSAFQQGAGVHLQRMLEARSHTQPSWAEEFWDDHYFSNRAPLPINVNYFFGFKSYKEKVCMTQVGRAASLLHAALEVYVQIRDGTFPTDHVNNEPLCMSQMRRVFCASRIPGETRDSIVSYSTAPLTADERLSKTCHYVATSPTHCVVIVRNRFYRVQVLDPTTHAVLSFIDIASAIEYAAAAAISAKEPAPPVGLLTTMHRGGWAEAYAHLKLLGNEDVLLAMQSAIMVVCLDSDEAKTPTDAAKLLLHGSGMNRWFDRHNLIVARNGVAGINFERSVGDATTALRIANIIAARDETRPLAEFKAARDPKNGLAVEMLWKLGRDGFIGAQIRSSFHAFRAFVLRNETEVVRFRHAGVLKAMFHEKDAALITMIDAFVQVALNLTYYRLYGHNCAVYEPASTRRFTHGRTETVRSATAEALAFCRSAMGAPLSAASRYPGQSELLHEAIEAHVKLMEAAKAGQGIDRHLLALVKVAEQHNAAAAREEDKIRLPEFMTNPDSAFGVSKRWILSTAHCGSKDVPLFGFGPAVPEGFGVAYMVFDKEIRVTVTCQRNRDVPRCRIFCHVLQESLLLMRALLDSTAVVARESRRVQSFSHPIGYADVPAWYLEPIALSEDEEPDEHVVAISKPEEHVVEQRSTDTVERVGRVSSRPIGYADVPPGHLDPIALTGDDEPAEHVGAVSEPEEHVVEERSTDTVERIGHEHRVLIYWDCQDVGLGVPLANPAKFYNTLMYTLESWWQRHGQDGPVFVDHSVAVLTSDTISSLHNKGVGDTTIAAMEALGFVCHVFIGGENLIVKDMEMELTHLNDQASGHQNSKTHVVVISGDTGLASIRQRFIDMGCFVHTVHDALPLSCAEEELAKSSSTVMSITQIAHRATPAVVVNVSGRLVHASLLTKNRAVEAMLDASAPQGSWCTRFDAHDVHTCPNVHFNQSNVSASANGGDAGTPQSNVRGTPGETGGRGREGPPHDLRDEALSPQSDSEVSDSEIAYFWFDLNALAATSFPRIRGVIAEIVSSLAPGAVVERGVFMNVATYHALPNTVRRALNGFITFITSADSQTQMATYTSTIVIRALRMRHIRCFPFDIVVARSILAPAFDLAQLAVDSLRTMDLRYPQHVRLQQHRGVVLAADPEVLQYTTKVSLR